MNDRVENGAEVNANSPANVDNLSRAGFFAGVAYDWSNLGAVVLTKLAKDTYNYIGGPPGVVAAAALAGVVGGSEQYVSARCANRVAEGKLAEKVRNSWVGRRLGVSSEETYMPMRSAYVASTSLLLGSNAVVLQERLVNKVSYQFGKDVVCKRTARIFGVTVGTLVGLGAGSSEIAEVSGHPEVSDQIIGTISSPALWGGILGLNITGGILKKLIKLRREKLSTKDAVK